MKKLAKKNVAYRYDELERCAQEKAKTKYLAEERLPQFFSENLVEMLSGKFGLKNLKTYYSLGYCQGDGLCLYGKIEWTELFDNDKFKKIAFKGIHYKQIQSIENELQGIDFDYQSRYYCANSVDIQSREYDPTDKQMEVIDKIVENVKSWHFSFCKEWEKIGYDYFYEISDSDMQEICDANDYLFTKDGQLIDQDEYTELAA